jgi:hypothetical protein
MAGEFGTPGGSSSDASFDWLVVAWTPGAFVSPCGGLSETALGWLVAAWTAGAFVPSFGAGPDDTALVVPWVVVEFVAITDELGEALSD